MKESKFQSTIGSISTYYAAGVASLSAMPRGSTYSRFVDAAREAGMSPQLLRNARRLAEPGGYTRKEFDALIRLMRRYEWPLYISTLNRLRSLKPDDRRKLECQAIKSKWAKPRIEAEIRRRFGYDSSRPGRPVEKYGPRALRVRYLELSEKWRRLFKTNSNAKLTRTEAERIKAAAMALEKLIAVLALKVKSRPATKWASPAAD